MRINKYEGWPGKLCTLLIFSLFDTLLPLNFSNTFRNSNSVKRGVYVQLAKCAWLIRPVYANPAQPKQTHLNNLLCVQ